MSTAFVFHLYPTQISGEVSRGIIIALQGASVHAKHQHAQMSKLLLRKNVIEILIFPISQQVFLIFQWIHFDVLPFFAATPCTDF